jgi:MoaA/NifB/PqqE/SkfB family radical SAM enzyme
MTTQNLRANQKNKYRALWEFSRGITCVDSIPVQLQIAPSNTCNFKCVYCCDHRVGNNVPRTKLDTQAWTNMLTLIPRAETLAFHGISEFMMDPKFFDIVRLCAESGATLFINTNGSVCTPKYLDVLAAYPGMLQMNFSVDAATPETFMRIRGWHFWRVLRNIKAYADRFGIERNRDRTSLALSFVIMKSNVKEMVPFAFLAKALGVYSVCYHRLHEYDALDWRIEAKIGGSFDYRKECVNNSVDEYNHEIEQTRKVAELFALNVTLPAPIEKQKTSIKAPLNQPVTKEPNLLETIY